MSLLKQIPLPVSGLILALISLGVLLQDFNIYFKYLLATIATLFITALILKAVFYPEDIRNDFENPVILSSCGTFSMSLMILSTCLTTFSPGIAYAIWIIGLALHILLMIYFTYRFIIADFNITAVYPSWWIVYVGITMGAITSHFHGITQFGFILFLTGFIAMLVTTPLIIYRYIRYPQIPDANRPLICIFTALFSILIVGYANSAPDISNEFLIGLYLIACLFYAFSFWKLISCRNLNFYPSFSAFTFPFVISATATKEMVKISQNPILNSILTMEMAIATVLVVFVLFKYLQFLKNSKKSRN